MTMLRKPVACCAVCALLTAAVAASPQTTYPPRKSSSTNSAAQALNRLLADAQAAIDRQDYPTAVQDYQDYLAKKPDDATVHYNLGYVYTAMEQPADARTEYEKAISLDPKMGAAYLNLALTLLSDDPTGAIEPLQKAVELMPGQARPPLLLGKALERSGKLSQAIDAFRAADKIDGMDFEIHYSLATALLDASRPAEAEPEFRAAIELHHDDSEAAKAELGLANTLIAQKKPEEAARELALYCELEPDDAEVRVQRASLLIDLGKDAEALAELDRAAATRLEDLRTLKMRSQIYYQAKRYDDAVAALQKAESMAPQDVTIAARLGHVYLEKKDYADAARQLAAAHGMDPKADDILSELVVAQFMTQNYAATLGSLDALSKRKDLPAESWFVRATCYDKLEQPAQALEAYQKFLELNKDQNNDMYFASAARVRALKRELEEKKR